MVPLITKSTWQDQSEFGRDIYKFQLLIKYRASTQICCWGGLIFCYCTIWSRPFISSLSFYAFYTKCALGYKLSIPSDSFVNIDISILFIFVTVIKAYKPISVHYSWFMLIFHLTDCLSSFTEIEELEDTELYMCNNCKGRQRSTKQFWIRRLPNVSLSTLDG